MSCGCPGSGDFALVVFPEFLFYEIHDFPDVGRGKVEFNASRFVYLRN
jgi:hypothetical protein